MKTFVKAGAAAIFALALGATASSSGCADAGHAGELMVIIQTDMSLPKDVDRARIEILAYGEHKFDEEYRKLGSEESLKLPGTIGVLVGEDPQTPVTIRVTAWQGAKARVLREAVTTVPEARLAELRLPMHWLCDGSATAADPSSNEVTSTCGEGLTCVAGSCVTNEIDSSSLPDYDEGSVFGGGSGEGDGSCFDTAACLRGSTLAPVSVEGGCSATVSGNVNVAIQTDGDGICGPAGCFVPLDADSDAGWKRRDDATIDLPQALCDKLATGTIVGVAVAPTSDACPQKDETLPTCGPWSSAGETPEPPGVTEPLALSTGQDHPAGLALSGGNLFWTNRGVFGEANAALRGVSTEGGSPTTVLEGLAGSRDLVVAEGTLFFTNGGTGPTDGSVFSVIPGANARNLCIDDGAPFALGVPEGIAVRGNDVIFTAFGEGALYRASADGTLLTDTATFHRLPIMGLQNYPYRVGIDGSRVYWTNEGTASADPPDGAVMMVAINDVGPDSSEATPTVLAGEQVTPRALLVEAVEGGESAIYFTTFAALGGVKRVDPSAPDQLITIAADQAYPNGLAVDATHVYWTNRGDGTVMRMPKGGAPGEPPTVIATGQVAPGPIVVDDTHVYWANEGTSDQANGSIMKIQKP